MYRNYLSASLLFTVLGLAAAPAQAEWKIYKFLDVGVAATDDLQLVLGEEVIYSVRPSVELAFKGNRFDHEIIGEVEVFRFGERGDDIVDGRLSLNTNGTLVQEFLFVSSSLDIAKVLPGDDFFDLTENTETQGRFKFNPFISRQIGQIADLFVGYSHQSLDDEFDGDIETTQNNLNFSLRRNPSFGGIIWSVGGNYERSRVSDDDFEQDFDSKSIFGSLGHTVGQTTFFEVITGREQNCCLLYTSPSPRDRTRSRMPSSA